WTIVRPIWSGCPARNRAGAGSLCPFVTVSGKGSIQGGHSRSVRAGEGNRTPVTSLEGWRTTIVLHPRDRANLSGWAGKPRRLDRPAAVGRGRHVRWHGADPLSSGRRL